MSSRYGDGMMSAAMKSPENRSMAFTASLLVKGGILRIMIVVA
jgi:hypothetical protein